MFTTFAANESFGNEPISEMKIYGENNPAEKRPIPQPSGRNVAFIDETGVPNDSLALGGLTRGRDANRRLKPHL